MHFAARRSIWLYVLAIFLLPCDASAAPVKDKDKPETAKSDFPEIDSDALLIAHLRIGDVWASQIVRDIYARAAKVDGGKELLQLIEKSLRKEECFWPGDFETATLWLGERNEEPLLALVLTAARPIDTDRFLTNMRKGNTSRKNFIALEDGLLLHFPDVNTAVLVHEALADRYLAGYANDKNGWPMNKTLKKAAEKNTFVAAMNPALLPADLRKLEATELVRSLLSAKRFTLIGNLKGNEIHVEMRGSFADDGTARKAKSELAKAMDELVAEMLDDERAAKEMTWAFPAFKEFKRALKDIKIALYGPDMVAKGVYKADFQIEQIVKKDAEARRFAAERGQSQENLKHLGLAIHNYANAGVDMTELVISGTGAKGKPIKSLDEKPLLSWRVALLPYLEQDDLYKQFRLNEPWDSEHNKKLIAKMPKIFAPTNNVKAPEGHTFYQMVIGPKAMRPGFTIATIPDGSSNTIAVVEAANPVVWTKPEDIFIPGEELPKNLKKRFGGLSKDGHFNVLLFDGSIRWVDSKQVSERTLWNAIQPDDGNPLGSDW
jgi:hypothetical protein